MGNVTGSTERLKKVVHLVRNRRHKSVTYVR